MIIAETALFTDAHESCRTNIGIAYGTFAVAFIAKTSDGDTGLLPAHYEIPKRWLVYEVYTERRFGLTDDGATYLTTSGDMKL